MALKLIEPHDKYLLKVGSFTTAPSSGICIRC